MSNPEKETNPGKIALITGAGSGIGRATAISLGSRGYRLVLAGRREQSLNETARLTGLADGECLVCSADVSIEPDVGSLFGKIQQRFGRLDLLFNNAGVSAAEAPIDELSLEQWNRVIAANLTGTFLCTREAVRMMKNQKPAGGRIINNGSLAASTPRPHSAPYAASKHAITGLTRATALDCRKYGIAVGQIDIGNAATDMAQGSATGALQPDGSILKEPLMDVQHVADAVVHMASLPLNANILFLTVMATGMPFIGRG